MKCPACENDVPAGRSACTRCGAPLPAAGERPEPEPGSLFQPLKGFQPQAGASNPKTEPLPVTDWDAHDDGPRTPPPSAFPAPEQPKAPDPFAGPAPHGAPDPYGAPNPFGPDPYGAPDPYGPGPYGGSSAGMGMGAGAEMGAGPGTGMGPGMDTGPGMDAGLGTGRPSPAPEAATQNLGDPMTGPSAYGYPPFPGEPGAPAGEGSGKNRKTLLLTCGIAAAVLIGGGLFFLLSQGGSKDGTPTSAGQAGGGNAAQQAAAVDQILKSGRTARGHLPAPLRTCADVAAGVPGFQQVVRDRQQELSRSKELKVDQLQNGARLRRSMIAAYQSSLDADQAYLAWAQEVRTRNCGDHIAPLTTHYKDAIAANDKAGPAKRQVATLWRPIASSHHLPAYAWNRL